MMQYFGGLASFPQHSAGYLGMLRSSPCQPSLRMDLCGPTTQGNLDFITICLKVTITQSVYGALSVYFLIYMTPLDGKSRALLPTDCGIL